MPSYDGTWFTPPAPLAYITLRNSIAGKVWSDVPMLLDSGTDATLLPQEAMERLDLAAIPDTGYELTGYDGSISISRVVQVDLLFLGRTFRGRFLLIDQNWGIIGRNILNNIAIYLDGPRHTWGEYKSS